MKVTVNHPLYEKNIVLDLPSDTTFAALYSKLLELGFVEPKRGGYHYIVDDQLCALDKTFASYAGEAGEISVRIHGLLTVLI